MASDRPVGSLTSPSQDRTSHAFGLRRPCRTLARILGIAALAWIVLRFLPAPFDHLGPIPALVSATPWLVIPLALALLLALLGRARVIALLMAACLILETAWQLPFYLDASHRLSNEALEREATEGTTVRAMTLNTFFGQADVDQIVGIVSEQGVDVLALQEVTPELAAHLETSELARLLPYRVGEDTGQQIWSRLPLLDMAADEVGFPVSPMCAASIELGTSGERLRFVSVHTTAPTGPWGAQWASSIALVGQLAQTPYQQGDDRYVLLGDFNATMDHRVFRVMLGERFSDAARSSASGIDFTWPANMHGVPQLISIDHMVLDEGVRAAQMQTITVDGSDHQALLFTLGVE